MNIGRIATLFLAGPCLAWDWEQKLGLYPRIIALAELKPGSVEEHVIYGLVAQSLGDTRTLGRLSYPLGTPQFRDGLLSLITSVNLVRSDAIDDPLGVSSIDYLVDRIHKTYTVSLQQFFGH